jgi:hypothetical protein
MEESDRKLRIQVQEALATAAQLQGTLSGQCEVLSQQQDKLQQQAAGLAQAAAEAQELRERLAAQEAAAEAAAKQLGVQVRELEEELKAAQADVRQLQHEVRVAQEQTQRHQARRWQGIAAAAGAVGAREDDPPSGPGAEDSAGEEGNGAGPGSQPAPSGPAAHMNFALRTNDGDYREGHSGVNEDQAEQMQILTQMVRDLKVRGNVQHNDVELLRQFGGRALDWCARLRSRTCLQPYL